MIIKKFEGTTESEAIEKAKEELGSKAIVMNVKTTKPKGIFRLFRKPVVEITAAVEEKMTTEEKTASVGRAKKVIEEAVKRQNSLQEEEETVPVSRKSSAIEKKLDNLADMLEKQMGADKTDNAVSKPEDSTLIENDFESKNDTEQTQQATAKNRIRELLYKQFLNNEVSEENAAILLDDLGDIPDKEEALDSVLANVYQKIVLKLGQPQIIRLNEENHPRVCFFVGSTGVGKTTTIAKIASVYKLEKKAKVALITSDTYRIAAVEQLKTYANILSLPIRVVYTAEEMRKAVEDYAAYDLVLVDTAGRSPRNEKQCDELSELLNSVRPELREVYLVLSATTKYKDLKRIVSTYNDMSDFRIVFTKLDETGCYGNILNVRMDTGAPLSYTTCGQVVPDDIGKVNAQAIAKQLLGGCE